MASEVAPHARDDPPWCDCGDRASTDFGAVFLEIESDGTAFIFFDRALTRRYGWTRLAIGPEMTLFGRRFDVRLDHDRRAPVASHDLPAGPS